MIANVFQTILHTKLLKKTTQVFTAQIIKFLSNRYAVCCASLPVTCWNPCSLLIARDLEANDLSRPGPSKSRENLPKLLGLKKHNSTGYQQNCVLFFYPSKIEWGKKNLSVGPIGNVLDSILIFHKPVDSQKFFSAKKESR